MADVFINNDALDILIRKLDNFVWSEKDQEERENLRQQFEQTYNKKSIDQLTKEDYFAGLGRKQGCLAYDLEWGTLPLGSIKGGSKHKYGYEQDFPKIKSVLQKLLSIDPLTVYSNDGNVSKELKQIITLSKEINGFKTGRTVIPKLLSIYYPEIFLPLFNDQDYLISKLLVNHTESENTGLELYLEYNFKLLIVKKKLEEISNRKFSNFEFVALLYYSFPKELTTQQNGIPIMKDNEKVEENFEALEVQHYQTLLHRNMHRLFPKLKYFDEEEQRPKNGQYDTQIVGTMDMLCTDEKGDFLIIEIKRQSSDRTLGQILRYMGWTKEELCKDGQKVKGLIVAERKDIQLDFALKIIRDVKFMKLGLTITLEE
jgi:hypothetical protein